MEKKPQEKKEPVNIRVRIDLRDSWSNSKKILPLPENVLGKSMELPLQLQKKENVFHVEGREIQVKLRDKPDERLRRVREFDLEILWDMREVNVSQELVIDLPEPVSVWWDGEKDGKEIWRHREKGFLVEKKGLLKLDQTRGDLLVRINLMNPEEKREEKGEKKEGMVEPKWLMDEQWRERYEL